MNCIKELKYKTSTGEVVVRVLQDLFEYTVVCFENQSPILRMIISAETQNDQKRLLGKSATDAHIELIEQWLLAKGEKKK